MATGFLDKLSASVSKTAKQVSDSAKVLADKNRVRRDIAAMENEIRNRFRDIGEKYFQEMRENPNPEYAEMFAAIIELQASLNEKQRELAAIDGMVSCVECGRGIAMGARFCPYCGANAPEPAMQADPMQRLCPCCGQPVLGDAMFCASCGTRVENPVVPPMTPPEAPSQLICPNCGEVLAPNALFCAVCGTAAPGFN